MMIKYLLRNRIVTWVLLFAFISSMFLSIYAYQLPLEKREARVLYEYATVGLFNYSVKLYPNMLYESEFLLNPSKVFLKLVDRIIINISYVLESSFPTTIIDNMLDLEVSLIHPQVWSKVINTVEVYAKNKVINYTVELDVPSLINLARSISQSVDISSSKYTVSINCVANTILKIYNTTKTARFPFTLQINIDLMSKMIEFSNNEFNNTFVSRIYDTSEYTVGVGSTTLSTNALRQIALALLITTSVLIAMPIGININRFYKERRREKTTSLKIPRKYRSLIIEASDIFNNMPSSRIVKVKGIDELAKLSENIVKPIVCLKTDNKHAYYVFDDDITFVYEHEE